MRERPVPRWWTPPILRPLGEAGTSDGGNEVGKSENNVVKTPDATLVGSTGPVPDS
jgi:hypothetical protein